MPSVTVPERTYQPGASKFDLSGLLSSRGVSLSLTRTASIRNASGDVATIDILSSVDGVLWSLVKRVSIPGGQLTGKDGVTLLERSRFTFTWPGDWENNIRTPRKSDHVRVVVSVLQTCRTSIILELL